MKGQKLPEEDKAKRAKVPKIVVTQDGTAGPVSAQGDRVVKKKGKPGFDRTKEPPEPEWEAINPDLTREEIEDRIAVRITRPCFIMMLKIYHCQLREFAIRFSFQLDLKLNSLDDLDEFEHFTDPSCVAFLKGMVNVLNREHKDKVRFTSIIKTSWINDYSSQGLASILSASKTGTFNVTKAWNAIEQARSMPDASKLLRTIPDPSEVASTSYNTRTGQRIMLAIQLIPILKYLMERTLETEIIHDELVEDGKTEWKAVHRQTINGVKELKEKLASDKKALSEKIEANEKNTDLVTELKRKVRATFPLGTSRN
jgi:hypothetical protein